MPANLSASPTAASAAAESPRARLTGPRHRAGTIVALVAAVAALSPWLINLGAIFPGGPTELLRYHIDFHVYREGAQALLDGDNLYTQDYAVRGINLPFTYPPLAAILLIPLTWVPMMVGAALWTLANVVLLWWCVVIVLRHCLPRFADADHRVLATWALPVALLFEPVRETLSFGQINLLLMTLVLADTLTRRPWLPRGVLIGLAAAIKLTPAVFILYFLIRRDWKGAATAVGSGVGFTLAAFAVDPRLSWTYWLDTISDTGRIGGLAYAANQSIQGLLFRLMPEGAVELVWLVLVVIALAGIIAAMVRVHRAAASPADSTVGLVVLNSLVALVCSPVSWSHHWVWLVPLAGVAAAAVWRAWSTGDRLAGRLAAGVLALTASCSLLAPHWSLPNTQDRELDWSLWIQPWGNTFVIVAVCTVVSVLLLPRLLPPLTRPATAENRDLTAHTRAEMPAARGWAAVQLVLAAVLTVGSVLLWLT